MVNLFGRTGFHHQACGCPQAFAHQMLVDGGQGEQSGYRHLCGTHSLVADDQDVASPFDRIHGGCAKRGQLGLDPFLTPTQGVGDVQGDAFELAMGVVLNVAQLLHVCHVQNRLRDLESHRRVDLIDVQQIGLGSNEGHQRHHDRFANRVDGRVGHLRKQLLEIIVEWLVFARQNRQWTVVAHGTYAFFTKGGHGGHQKFDVLLGVAKGLLQIKEAVFRGTG